MGDLASSDKLHAVLQFDDDRSTSELVSEISTSYIFQIDWPQFVSVAPLAISSMGSCFVACAGTTAERITLTPPPGASFKFLAHGSLAANLVECGSLGQQCFRTAHTNMSDIRMKSKMLQSKIPEIIQCLQRPEDAKVVLQSQMMTLKQGADVCRKLALEIDHEFSNWLMYTGELHAACVSTDGTTEEKLSSKTVAMSIAQVLFDNQKNAVEEAKKIRKRLEKDVELTSDAFKKASDEFPSSWDLLAQEIIGGLFKTSSTALAQGLDSCAKNLNPMSKASAGVDIFSGVLVGNQKDGKTDGGDSTVSPPPAPEDYLLPKADDPAYAQVRKELPYLSALNTILTKGKDGGIDWTLATEGAGKGIAFLSAMLNYSQREFSGIATGDEPSSQLRGILSSAASVASEIEFEVKKSSDMSYKHPDSSSSTVQGWRIKIRDAYQMAQTLDAMANLRPGTVPGSLPLMSNNGKSPQELVNGQQEGSLSSQAKLQIAQQRLESTQQTFIKSQEIYQKAADAIIAQQNKLAEMQDKLKEYAQTSVDLDGIKKVLLALVVSIIQMKGQFADLVKFFEAISKTVENIVDLSVRPFVDAIRGAAGDGDGERFKIGNFTFADFQRTMIFHQAVSLRAYFGVFDNVTKMYIEVSDRYMMHGLKIVDAMSQPTRDEWELKRRIGDLQRWSQDADQQIQTLTKSSKEDILQKMAGRIEKIQAMTKMLPAAPEVKKAIEEGSNIAGNAAKDAITRNAANKPLNKWKLDKVI